MNKIPRFARSEFSTCSHFLYLYSTTDKLVISHWHLTTTTSEPSLCHIVSTCMLCVWLHGFNFFPDHTENFHKSPSRWEPCSCVNVGNTIQFSELENSPEFKDCGNIGKEHEQRYACKHSTKNVRNEKLNIHVHQQLRIKSSGPSFQLNFERNLSSNSSRISQQPTVTFSLIFP